MQDKKTMQMVQLAILTAIVLLMAFTPLGYLRTGGLSISLLTIPVAIGAMILGPGAGAVLGTIFGLTSFYQCFGMSVIGTAMLGINPFFTFLVCVPTRALMGFVTGIVFRAARKRDRTRILSYYIGGLSAACFNTLFYMSTLLLCFWNTEYLQSINATLGNLNPLVFVFVFVGINGAIELPSCCLVAGTISKTLEKAFKLNPAMAK
ncbi:MAG: ECF transporter S component [Lachnospiraceae bacterium]|nr:ECF transporter S component [Lachnospiraceae bacterium]